MSITVRILIAIASISFVSALGFIIYNQVEIKKQQTAIQTQVVQQQQLVDGIVRSSSTWTTKQDLQSFADANKIDLQAIQDNLKSLNATLSAINVATTSSSGQVATNMPTTSVGSANPTPPSSSLIVPCLGGVAACPNQDPFGYLKAQQDLALNEDFPNNTQVPFGSVGFSAWQKDPWNTNILARKYSLATTVGVDTNGKEIFYNKFSVNVNGKDYDIPITNATTKQQVINSSFSFWSPRFGLTTGGSINATHLAGDVNLGATFQFMSWGKTKVNPMLSVLQVGVGYEFIDKSPAVIINPISLNLGQAFGTSVITNTYLGPSFQVDLKGNVFAGLSLSLGL